MSFYIQAKHRHFYQYSLVSACSYLSSFLLFSSASSKMHAKKSCILLTSDLYMTTSFIYSSFAKVISQVATFLACSSLILLQSLHFSLSSSIFFSFLSTYFKNFIYISCSLWMQICVFEIGAMVFGDSQFSLFVDWNFLAVLLNIFSLIWDRCIVNFIIFILIKVNQHIQEKVRGM